MDNPQAKPPPRDAVQHALAHALASVVRRQLGAPGEVRNLTRLTGGAVKVTWSFDAVIGDAVVPLILQQTPPERAARTPGLGMLGIQSGDEAVLLGAARDAGVPVPVVRAVLTPGDGLGGGTITERVAGETLGRKLVADPQFAAARSQLAAQCGRILAAIHRIDTEPLPFLAAMPLRAQLTLFRALADACEHPLPGLELGLRWVAENAYVATRTTVVHGDFRTGNLIVDETGARCVLDWELAHRGDPLEDLGWLCVKTWRFGGQLPVGGFGHRDDLFAAYEQASGIAVDPRHVRFWEAFGCVRWAVMCMMMSRGPGSRRTVESVAIGRRIEEPLLDLLELITGKDP